MFCWSKVDFFSLIEDFLFILSCWIACKFDLCNHLLNALNFNFGKLSQGTNILCTDILLQSPLALPYLQIEPMPSGNVPPGFDTSTCRSVWVIVGLPHLIVVFSIFCILWCFTWLCSTVLVYFEWIQFSLTIFVPL